MLKPDPPDQNVFAPRQRTATGETRVIGLVLAGWLLSIVGFQLVVYLLEYSGQAKPLSAWTFFNLPIPFWLTGQFLPLWFIVLCVLFNIWIDRHDTRGQTGSFRFRVRSGSEGGE